jgi:protein-S-isoprenylcysteine O-methyltransferase Ste14
VEDLVSKSRPLIGGVIVLYFIIGLEVLVMISPFAAFFYAAFNPFLLFLARWPATHWLADFFLPHMVLPPGAFLKTLRVAGSVLFVSGALTFLICAVQVYFHKFSRRGPALGGLYAWIRHPQYTALATTGLGLAILWPRFLTVVFWTVMVGLYYLLARDEERRMVAAFGDQYSTYMSRTGMFIPRALEDVLARIPGLRSQALRVSLALPLILALAVGSAFALRSYTVARLPLWSNGRVSVLAVLPGDTAMLQHRMEDVLQMPEVQSRLAKGSGAVLGYIVPVQYVMQGMIADTDPAYRLYEHHQTMAMIGDWIFHPFRHLEGGHSMMHHATGGVAASASPTVRRIIFLRVASSGNGSASQQSSLFAVGAVRVPQFFIDVDMHPLTLLDVRDLGTGTGWGHVPTPMF